MLRNDNAIIQLYFNILNTYSKKNLLFLCPPDKNNMLQRIQTIYLFFAALVSGGLIFLFELWINEAGESIFAHNVMPVFLMFMVSAFLSLVSIFLFKNRKLQFVLGRLNILLNLILLGLFVYWSLSVPGEFEISEKGIGVLIPIVSIVFLVLANKAIKKDEDLVKSVDRLR